MFEEFVLDFKLNEIGDSQDYAKLTWGETESYDYAKFEGTPGKFLAKFNISNKTLAIDFDRDDKKNYEGSSSDALWVLKNVINAVGLYFEKHKDEIKMVKFKSSYESDAAKADKRIEIYKNYFKSWAQINNVKILLLSQTSQEETDDDTFQSASCLYSITY